MRFLTDENFNGPILLGVRLRLPHLDIVRVQDVGLRTFRDERVLEFAALNDRIVLSHDVNTMKRHAEDRMRHGKLMPGLFLVRQDISIGRAIEEIVMVAECSEPAEWNGEIRFLPL